MIKKPVILRDWSAELWVNQAKALVVAQSFYGNQNWLYIKEVPNLLRMCGITENGYDPPSDTRWKWADDSGSKVSWLRVVTRKSYHLNTSLRNEKLGAPVRGGLWKRSYTRREPVKTKLANKSIRTVTEYFCFLFLLTKFCPICRFISIFWHVRKKRGSE